MTSVEAVPVTSVEAVPAFDLLIAGGDVADGSGSARFRADVGVTGDRIVAVGDLHGATAREVVDARGRVTAPGFIDVHVHSEVALLTDSPDATGGLLQGVTTHLTAPDGFGFAQLPPAVAREVEVVLRFVHGPADLSFDWPTPEVYLRAFEGHIPLNVAAQAPHLPIRVAAMGWEARRARPHELDRMRALTHAWMDAGAVGFNSGLDYQPTAHSDTDELVALATIAAEYGGAFSAHGRNIEFGRAGAFNEIAEVGRRAGLPVCVSHERVDDELAGLLTQAAGEPGVDLTTESHLYEAGSTHLIYYLPFAEQIGGPAAVLERLGSAAYRADLAARLEHEFAGHPQVLNAYFSATRTGRHLGRSLRDIAADEGRPAGETVVQLMRDELPDALMVYPWGPTEAEFRPIVARSLQHPRVIVSSDALCWGSLPHPRRFGTIQRAIRVGVRELGAVTLEAAINRMTGLPAERYGLSDRGRVATAAAADLVVLDPKTIADRATYAEPRLPPIGIDEVIVNGVRVVERGMLTDRRPGCVLRRA